MSDFIDILIANESHADSIFLINSLSFPVPWDKASILQELSDNDKARYVVAKVNDTIVGYGGLWKILDEGHITNIAIHPQYRGMGIGNRIVQSLIELCSIEDITSMTLEVRASNIAAINLYKKFGFITEGIRKHYYSNNNEDALIMWRRQLI